MAITHAFNGKVLITFHEGKHYYTVQAPSVFKDTLHQPSVTGVIGMKDKSAALVHWSTAQFAEKMKSLIASSPEEYLNKETLPALVDAAKDTWRVTQRKAADIGSLAHRVFEAELKGEYTALPLKIDPIVAPNIDAEMMEQANNAILAGMKFIREHNIEVVQAEAPRWSPTYGYIGTGDLIAYIDGKLAVLDWKTSKRLYPTVRLQLSAYKQAYEEEHPGQIIEWRVAVNTGKDGELDFEIHENDTHDGDLKVFLGLLDTWRWDRENQGKWSKEAPRQLTASEISKLVPTN